MLSILILFVFYYYSPWDTGLYIITMEIHIDTDYSSSNFCQNSWIFRYKLGGYLHLFVVTQWIKIRYTILTGFDQLEPPSSGSAVLNLFAGLTGLFSITWFILIVYFYFKTKKTISHFPPNPNDEDSTQRVVLAFKRSILIILILPIIVMFIAGLITASRVVRGIADSLPDYPSGDTVNFDSVIRMLALEKVWKLQCCHY